MCCHFVVNNSMKYPIACTYPLAIGAVHGFPVSFTTTARKNSSNNISFHPVTSSCNLELKGGGGGRKCHVHYNEFLSIIICKLVTLTITHGENQKEAIESLGGQLRADRFKHLLFFFPTKQTVYYLILCSNAPFKECLPPCSPHVSGITEQNMIISRLKRI